MTCAVQNPDDLEKAIGATVLNKAAEVAERKEGLQVGLGLTLKFMDEESDEDDDTVVNVYLVLEMSHEPISKRQSPEEWPSKVKELIEKDALETSHRLYKEHVKPITNKKTIPNREDMDALAVYFRELTKKYPCGFAMWLAFTAGQVWQMRVNEAESEL